MRRYTVTVTDFAARQRNHQARVLATDASAARSKGLAKLFGRHSFWKSDSGLGPDYGQVFERTEYGNSSRTGRASIAVLDGWS